MKKIRLSDTDLEFFDLEVSPLEFVFFQRHKDAFRCMWKEQGKPFWTRFTITFRSFTVKHGVIKQMSCDTSKFENMLDDAFIYIHEQFVDGREGTARGFVEDCAVLARNHDKLPQLDSKSVSKDPFYLRETRDIFRRFFGPPDQKSSYVKVYILTPIYLRYSGSVCRCLKRWMEAPTQECDDDSYWTPPSPTQLEEEFPSSDTGSKVLMCMKCLDECSLKYFRERLCGDNSGPKFVDFWDSDDPRFNDSKNPLYNEKAVRDSDWRDELTPENYKEFVHYVRLKSGDKCPDCALLADDTIDAVEMDENNVNKSKKKKKKKKNKDKSVNTEDQQSEKILTNNDSHIEDVSEKKDVATMAPSPSDKSGVSKSANSSTNSQTTQKKSSLETDNPRSESAQKRPETASASKSESPTKRSGNSTSPRKRIPKTANHANYSKSPPKNASVSIIKIPLNNAQKDDPPSFRGTRMSCYDEANQLAATDPSVVGGFNIVKKEDVNSGAMEIIVSLTAFKTDEKGNKITLPNRKHNNPDTRNYYVYTASFLRKRIENLPEKMQWFEGRLFVACILDYEKEEGGNGVPYTNFSLKVTGVAESSIKSTMLNLLQYVSSRKKRPSPGWSMEDHDVVACLLPEESRISHEGLSIHVQKGMGFEGLLTEEERKTLITEKEHSKQKMIVVLDGGIIKYMYSELSNHKVITKKLVCRIYGHCVDDKRGYGTKDYPVFLEKLRKQHQIRYGGPMNPIEEKNINQVCHDVLFNTKERGGLYQHIFSVERGQEEELKKLGFRPADLDSFESSCGNDKGFALTLKYCTICKAVLTDCKCFDKSTVHQIFKRCNCCMCELEKENKMKEIKEKLAKVKLGSEEDNLCVDKEEGDALKDETGREAEKDDGNVKHAEKDGKTDSKKLRKDSDKKKEEKDKHEDKDIEVKKDTNETKVCTEKSDEKQNGKKSQAENDKEEEIDEEEEPAVAVYMITKKRTEGGGITIENIKNLYKGYTGQSREKLNKEKEKKMSGVDTTDRRKETDNNEKKQNEKGVSDGGAKMAESKQENKADNKENLKVADNVDTSESQMSESQDNSKPEMKESEHPAQKDTLEEKSKETEDDAKMDVTEKKAKNLTSPRNKLRSCANCQKVEPAPKTYKKCQKCKLENVESARYYCSRPCQVEDWTLKHKNEHRDKKF